MKTIGRIGLMPAIVTVLMWSALDAHGQTISFGAASAFPAGVSPTSVATGAFTSSGKPDVAVTNQHGVTILLNDGSGGLVPGSSFAAGTNPQSVAIDDFDGNGKNDLAVVNQGSGTVSIFLGNGDGSFGSGASFAAGTNPRMVLTGDFNKDGKRDLVVVDSGTGPGTSGVSILIGNGDGSFKPASFVALGSGTISATIGDFDGDGKADLAAVNPGSDSISILIGKGDGTFQTPATISLDQPGISVTPTSIVAGDFNKNGKLDLAVATPNVHDVAVLVGNGNGTFGPPIHYALDDPNFVNNVNKLASVDLNGDGYPDLVLDNLSSNHVTVLLNKGDGTFPTASSYAAGPEPIGIAIGDFNGDGSPDVIVADNAVDGEVALLIGNTDGTFQAAPLRRSGFAPSSLAVGDFNGDGKLDLITVSTATLTVSGLGTGTVMLGNADGTFQAPKIWSTSSMSSVAVGDFDGDGKLDLVETNPTPGNGSLSLLLGKGDGTFQPATNYTVGTTPVAVAVADLDGDGKPDVIVANRNSVNISVLLNTGTGTLKPAVDYPTPTTGTPESIAIGDFNGDGLPDIAVAISGINATSVAIFINNGNGTFQPYISIPSGFSSSAIIHVVAADFDGDGNADLAVTDGATLSVLLASGKTAFQSKTYLVGAGAAINGTVVVADLNGDLKPDLVTSSRDGLAVLINTGDGGFQAPIPYAPFLGGAIAVGDFYGVDAFVFGNVGDGRPDIVAADSAQDSTTTDTIAVIPNQSTGPQVTVTAQTSPTGLPLSVYYGFPDGNALFTGCTAPCTYDSSFGLFFQIYAGVTIPGSTGVQYALDHFSDNGFNTLESSGANIIHDVQVLAVPTTVTAYYRPQYQVTVVASPSQGGVVSPASGNFYDSGAFVPLSAVANPGYTFVGWTGSATTPNGPFKISCSVASCSVPVDGPTTMTASFTAQSAPLATLSASNLSFGNQRVGTTSASQQVTLSNTGDAPLAITSIAVTGTNASSFGFANNCGSSLAAGASCLIHGHFAPSATGAFTATITITDNAGGSPQLIALTGTGVTPPAVALSATSLAFGSQGVGTTSASQSVTLTNTGGAALAITSITVTGANASSFVFGNSCGASVAAGASCTIHGHFSPSTTGALTAAVTIVDNAAGSPQSITLTGTGTNPTTVSLSANSLSFGLQKVGSTSASQSVTLTNTGAATLAIANIAVTGADASSFVFGNTCGTSLAAGATCAIHGHFTPAAAGALSAAVTITDNGVGSPQSIALSGTGYSPTTVSLSSASLSFGTEQVGATSASQQVTMTNTGSATLYITSISLTGADASSFLFANNCGTSLAAGASCLIHGHFTPASSGALTAAVTLVDSAAGSPQTITLSGMGH